MMDAQERFTFMYIHGWPKNSRTEKEYPLKHLVVQQSPPLLFPDFYIQIKEQGLENGGLYLYLVLKF